MNKLHWMKRVSIDLEKDKVLIWDLMEIHAAQEVHQTKNLNST